MSLGGSVGSVDVDVRLKVDDSELDRAEREAEQGGSSLGGTIGRGMIAGFAAVWAGGQALEVGKDLVNTAREIDAGLTLADQAFGESREAVDEWASGLASDFGVAEDRLLSMAGNTGDLLSGLGATEDQAASLSTQALELAGVLSLASGGTTSMTEASERLDAALVGETDGLKSLGIAISQADVEARLLAQGQAELTGEARRAAEAQAVLDLAYEQSTIKVEGYANGLFDTVVEQNQLNAVVDEGRVALSQMVEEGWNKLVGFLVDTVIPAWQELWPTIDEALTAIGERTDEVLTAVREFWAVWGDEIMAVVDFVMNDVVTQITAAMDAVANIFELVSALLRGDWSAAWQAFRDLIGTIMGAIRDRISTIWDAIVGIVGDGISAIVGFVKGLPGQIADAVAGAWDSLYEGFIQTINAIIRGWNRLGFTIPRISFTFPSFNIPGIGQVGGASIGAGPWGPFRVPQIPELASGGVINEPMLAMVGETAQARPEIVTPERLMADTFRRVLAESGQVVQVFIGDEQLEPKMVRVVDRQMAGLHTRLVGGRR